MKAYLVSITGGHSKMRFAGKAYIANRLNRAEGKVTPYENGHAYLLVSVAYLLGSQRVSMLSPYLHRLR